MDRNLILLILILTLLNGCSTIKDGFESQRKSSTDEFLVEKKQPLVMPPDYKDLPVPESEKKKDTNENFQKLVVKEETNSSKNYDENTKQQNTEKFILEKIKDN